MRHSKKDLLSSAAFLFLSAVTVFAAEPTSALSRLKTAKVPVTVAFTGAAAFKVFDALGKSTGLIVSFQASPDVKVTVDLKNLSLEKALEILGTAGHFVFEVSDPDHLIVRSST